MSGGYREMLWSVLKAASARDLWQPGVLAVSVGLQLLYLAVTIGPLKHAFKDAQPVPGRKIASFISSMWVMYLAFAGPLDYLSDEYLFSAHMVSHMLEIMLMTPLFIRGIPNWLFQPLLSWRPTRVLIKGWSYPLVAGGVFNVVYSAFHTPSLYNETLASDSFHFFEHFVFFIVAFFMWLPSISPFEAIPPLTPGRRLLYLVYNYNLMMPVVILLLVAQHPWYPVYAEAPRVINGFGPLADMEIGGVIMAVGSVIPYVILGVKAYSRQNEAVWYS